MKVVTMVSVYFTEDDMCTTQKLEVKRIYDFLLANDWSVTTDLNKADVVICPTCSGWENLEIRSLERLRKMNTLGKNVVSVGCVNTVNPSGVAGVHSGLVVPTQKLEHISSLIPNPKVKLCDIPEPSAFKSKEDYRLYDLRKRFVNITAGCPFNCSYCPHKVGIGPLKSRPMKHIIAQIKDLVATTDVKIIVLTGLETAYYGRDIGTSYPTLLKKILEIDATFDIHVAQFNPAGISKYYDELLSLFSNERVTDIQIPIQTTCKRLLKLMRRPQVTEQQLGRFLRMVKNNNKRVVLRTDIIVGYPTETLDELIGTLHFVTDIYDEVAVYSIEIRKGLPIEKMKEQAHTPEEIQRRIEFATKFIEDKGVVAHGGQQTDVYLVELEKRREALRMARHSCL